MLCSKRPHLSFQSSSGKLPWYVSTGIHIDLIEKIEALMLKIKFLYLIAIDQVNTQHHRTDVYIISLYVWLKIFEFEVVVYISEIDWTVWDDPRQYRTAICSVATCSIATPLQKSMYAYPIYSMAPLLRPPVEVGHGISSIRNLRGRL
jgi:hypothetical protein